MAFPYDLLIIKKGKSLKIKLSQHYAIQDEKKFTGFFWGHYGNK